ncbi:hypothetical protein [Pseudomonas serbica]|jgi:hypothetical protein|uniref:hypothetical protein n=1 Tax=Pseudomonas serbica TaxID=2965074 RepID=UPI00237B047B|nr:hypothetical protein [Pseudomonas serbica]
MKAYHYAFDDKGVRLSSIIVAENLRHAAKLFFESPNGEFFRKKHKITHDISLGFSDDHEHESGEVVTPGWTLNIKVYQRGDY